MDSRLRHAGTTNYVVCVICDKSFNLLSENRGEKKLLGRRGSCQPLNYCCQPLANIVASLLAAKDAASANIAKLCSTLTRVKKN